LITNLFRGTLWCTAPFRLPVRTCFK